ncbi:MAG: SPOR domain-containing protein, partial [Desulfovibrio sp.]|nr:SPOR domain-containing protein [Desulfovibrio sp.]
MQDYVFQVGAFRDEDSVDSLRQRLEGRGLRTRMQREGKLYV